VRSGGVWSRLIVGAVAGGLAFLACVLVMPLVPWPTSPRWLEALCGSLLYLPIPGYVLANAIDYDLVRPLTGQFAPWPITDVMQVALNPVLYGVSWALVTSKGSSSRWNRIGVALAWVGYLGLTYRWALQQP
jgi:hypothetical protein